MSRLWTPKNVPNSVSVAAGPDSVRVLVCAVCETIEVLPPYDGPADSDRDLIAALRKHQPADKPEHVGGLFRVSPSDWNNTTVRTQVLEQIVAQFNPDAETGLGAETYAMKDNFMADAMACWGRHSRTPTCSDYKTDKMLITPDTQAERKELGMDPFDKNDPGVQQHLCVYCPVHSLVQQAARKKAGMYDK